MHKIVDAPLVAGYMGGSIIDVWEKLLPLVEVDRVNRAAAGRTDHKHWLEYFKYLYDAAVATEAMRENEDKRVRPSCTAYDTVESDSSPAAGRRTLQM